MTAIYEAFKLLIGRFYSFVIGLEDNNWLGIVIKAFIVTSIVLIVLWVIPLTRKIAGHLLHHKYRFFFLWLWKLVLILWRAHINILENILKPKAEIFSSLEKDLAEEENRARNR